MHGVKIVGLKRLNIEEAFFFDPNDFTLVDIVNDASVATTSKSFLSDPGAFVYDFELSYDATRVQDEMVRAIRMEFFLEPPSNVTVPKRSNAKRPQRVKYEQDALSNELDSNLENPFVSIEIDIGVPLPNESIQSDGVTREQLHAGLTQTSNVVLSGNASVQNRGSASAITALPVNEQSLPPTNRSAPFLNRSNLRNGGTDPAKNGQSAIPRLPNLASVKQPSIDEPAPRFDPYGYESNGVTLIRTEDLQNRYSLQTLRNRLLGQLQSEAFNNSKTRMAQVADRTSYNANVRSNQANDAESSTLPGQERSRTGAQLKERTRLSNDSSSIQLGSTIRIDSSIINRKFRMELNKRFVGVRRTFYVRISTVLSDSRRSKTVTTSNVYPIQHSEQLKRLLVPKAPPRMERVRNDGGSVSFRVVQQDPTATKVIITKRTITPDPYDDEPSSLMGEYDLKYEDTALLITDDDANNWQPNQTMYSAITQHDGQDGPFESLVFDGARSAFVSTTDQDDGTTKLSIVASNTQESVEIRIGRIPENVTALTLYREDVNAIGSRRDRVSIVSNIFGHQSTVINNGNDGLTFFDRNVRRNDKHRYFCVLTMRGGQRVESNDDVILVRRITRDKLPLDVEIYQPSIQRNVDNSISINVDIITRIKTSTFQFVKELLTEQDANQEFLQEIENNRDELTDMMMFRVQRVDLRTGSKINLGFHKNGTFVDDAQLSSRLKVPPLRSNRKYLYSFTACLVPPSVFLKGVFNKLSSGKKLGENDIEYLANKFDNYVVRNFGLLPSNSQLTRNLDPEQLILQGDTGISFDTIAETPIFFEAIESIRTSDSRNGTRVSWNLSSLASSLIDYCVVFVTVNGFKEMIGSVKNSNVSASMYHLDDRYHLSIGKRFYSVIAVFYDGTNSNEIQTEELERRSNVHPRVLKAMLQNGQTQGESSDSRQSNVRREEPGLNRIDPEDFEQQNDSDEPVPDALRSSSAEQMSSDNNGKDRLSRR